MDRQSIDLVQVHNMEQPNVEDINSNISKVANFISKTDESIVKTTENYKNLLLNSKLQIESVKRMLLQEKERLQDINILCNKYSDFESIINITDKELNGSLTYKNEILSATLVDSVEVDYSIDSIEGNGLEGNSFILLNEDFISKTLNTSDRKAICDRNKTTFYEYQRITLPNRDEDMPVYFNKDSIDATCQITISSKETFNEAVIQTDRNDLVLNKVYTSLDGLSYTLDKEYDVEINNLNEVYEKQDYVFKGGIIQFTPCRFVKIILSSAGYSNEEVAYKKVFIDALDEDNKIERIESVKSAKRHLIKINDILIKKSKFRKGMSITRELITDRVKCLSLFCNEYISTGRIEDNVKYYLIANGIEHEIVPINAHRNGKKIIRVSSQANESINSIYVKEDIKNAKLKIVITNSNQDISPLISNIKILIGDE